MVSIKTRSIDVSKSTRRSSQGCRKKKHLREVSNGTSGLRRRDPYGVGKEDPFIRTNDDNQVGVEGSDITEPCHSGYPDAGDIRGCLCVGRVDPSLSPK